MQRCPESIELDERCPGSELRSSSPFRPGAWPYRKQAVKARAMAWVDRLVGRRHERAFGILTYHRVAPIPAEGWREPADLLVTPARLRHQLAGLIERGFQPWPLARVVDCDRRGEPIPRDVFVVVFDDGYEGVRTHAAPVLAELGVPATVFLPTAYLGRQAPFPFDPWPLAGEADPATWRPLDRDGCESLLESGLWELGTHTHTHEDYRGRPAELVDDLGRSLERLRREFGLVDVPLAYPFGGAPELAAAARAAGVSCGVTGDCQLVLPGEDRLQWGRFGAEQYDTPATLAAKLNGAFSMVQNWWRRLRGGEPRPTSAGVADARLGPVAAVAAARRTEIEETTHEC